MVRYDKCVEALYDRGLIEDKNKSLQMLKVMKGAISMSKSKTGECIFRTNKLEKKNLERVVKIDKRNSVYNIARVDTGKKSVVGRWLKMLEKQTTCSPQTLLEEALYIKEPSGKTPVSTSENSPLETEEEEWKLRKFLDLRLARDETRPFLKRKIREPDNVESEENETKEEIGEDGFVTERKEIRERYTKDDGHVPPVVQTNPSDRKIQGVTLSKSLPLVLPSLIGNAGFKHAQSNQQSEKQDENQAPVFERDLTDWKDWRLKDKSWIMGYIRREKTRHEDLILRNALVKIETDMSGSNTIRRQQVRQKLCNERDEEIKRERETAMDRLSVTSRNRSKSETQVKPRKYEFKKSRTQISDSGILTKSRERKLSREKSVSFADNEPNCRDNECTTSENLDNDKSVSADTKMEQEQRDTKKVNILSGNMRSSKSSKISINESVNCFLKKKPVSSVKRTASTGRDNLLSPGHGLLPLRSNRNTTVCIVYQEDEDETTNNPYTAFTLPQNKHMSRKNTLSANKLVGKLPIIVENSPGL